MSTDIISPPPANQILTWAGATFGTVKTERGIRS